MHSPLAFGFIKKKIILPCGDSYEYSEDDILLVLSHELMHIKNNDSLYDNESVYDLTDSGAFVYSNTPSPTSVNYIPAQFRTRSTRLSLKLLSGETPILVYVYYSDALDEPILQLTIEKKTPDMCLLHYWSHMFIH